MNSGVACQAWRTYSTVTCARWAATLYCWKCLGCHGNCCSWYSAVLVIFMVNYKVLYCYIIDCVTCYSQSSISVRVMKHNTCAWFLRHSVHYNVACSRVVPSQQYAVAYATPVAIDIEHVNDYTVHHSSRICILRFFKIQKTCFLLFLKWHVKKT